MAGLIDEIFENAAWTPSAVRFENTVPAADPNDPIVSASSNASGEAIADEYDLSFSDVVAGVTAKVYVQTQSPNNPYRDPTIGRTVNIDGTTVYDNIVPGVDLVFSASGSFVNTWTATIKVGTYLGTFQAYGAGAGDPGDSTKHRVHNTDAGAAASCLARLINMCIQVITTPGGRIFSEVKPFAEQATEKTAGGGSERVMPYAVTVVSIAGGVFDLEFDGNPVTVKNMDTSDEGDSTDLDPDVFYEIQTGGLQSVQFKIDSGAQVTDTVNLMIFQPRYLQIAPDVSGTPGTWGSDDVNLTQSGESAGTIQPDQVAYFWARALVPDGANAESNPYPANVALQGLQTGTAGWVA